jgi:hypothetical protein
VGCHAGVFDPIDIQTQGISLSYSDDIVPLAIRNRDAAPGIVLVAVVIKEKFTG